MRAGARPPPFITLKVGSLKINTALEYSTRVVQEGDRRCKKSTLNDLAYLTPLRIPLMNPALHSPVKLQCTLQLSGQTTEYISLQEMKQGQCICPLSWSVHCNFTGDDKCNKRGWGCTPHPHQPRQILPSWLNVRQKADVTTLCTLWGRHNNNVSSLGKICTLAGCWAVERGTVRREPSAGPGISITRKQQTVSLGHYNCCVSFYT